MVFFILLFFLMIFLSLLRTSILSFHFIVFTFVSWSLVIIVNVWRCKFLDLRIDIHWLSFPLRIVYIFLVLCMLSDSWIYSGLWKLSCVDYGSCYVLEDVDLLIYLFVYFYLVSNKPVMFKQQILCHTFWGLCCCFFFFFKPEHLLCY